MVVISTNGIDGFDKRALQSTKNNHYDTSCRAFSTLADWLTKGEKASSYRKQTKVCILKSTVDDLSLVNCDKYVFLYHLELLQLLQHAINDKKLYAYYHSVILRQAMENVSSFLGTGRVSYALKQIGIDDANTVARIINMLSHKTVFRKERVCGFFITCGK